MDWRDLSKMAQMKQLCLEEIIYAVMCDEIEEKEVPEELPVSVENEFDANREGAVLYEQVYEYKTRILQRLEKENGDNDLDEMMNLMEELAHYLGIKMYRYGQQMKERPS